MKRNTNREKSDANEPMARKPFSSWDDEELIETYIPKREQDTVQQFQTQYESNVPVSVRRVEAKPRSRKIVSPPPRRRRTSRVLFILLIVLAVLIVAFSMVWNYITGKFMKDPDGSKPAPTIIATDVEGSEHIVTPTPIPTKSAYAEGIKNILMIGSDSRDDGEHDLADVIMILTIDNNAKQLKLSSIQRDMLVYVGGDTSNLKKINSVLEEGPELLVHTINENLSLDLQGYVEIDMTGTETIIDLMNGIEVDIPDDEAFISQLNLAIFEQNVLAEGWDNKENYIADIEESGMNVLNGRQALAYMRVRKTDSDYRRTERQRQVLELLLRKFLKQNPLKMAQIVREGLGFVHTSLDAGDIFSLATSVVPALSGGMEQMQIPATGTFWEDSNGNIVPSFKLMNPMIHEFVYGDRSHELAVAQIPQSPALLTNYYIEPETDRFVNTYARELGMEEAKKQSIEEYQRQVAAGYEHREPPIVWQSDLEDAEAPSMDELPDAG